MTRRLPKSAAASPAGSATRYRDRIFDDTRHDPYQEKGKYQEPTVCSDCRAVFHHGRWVWATTPPGAHESRCPACHRTHDRLPAGSVTIVGPFVVAHRQELLALVDHVAAHEREQHPMHRVMHVDDRPDQINVTTTDIHLPQRIAKALKNAYDGEFDVCYGDDEYTVRVSWRR